MELMSGAIDDPWHVRASLLMVARDLGVAFGAIDRVKDHVITS
jgi:hypothetical protein